MSPPASRFPQVIVLGTDGSDGALCATDWVAELAAATNASVRVVHVLTYDRELVRDLTFDTVTTWRRTLDGALRTSWIAALRERQVAYRCALVEDVSPAVGLIRAADRERADLIVIGSRGRRSVANRVLGSTSYSLTHHASQPVVVVPPFWHRPEGAQNSLPSTRENLGAGLG